MKEQILDIIQKNVYSGDVYTDTDYPIFGHDIAADELEQLMCYREVRAFFAGMGNPIDNLPNTAALMMEPIIKGYPIDVLTKAIEQVKNELK